MKKLIALLPLTLMVPIAAHATDEAKNIIRQLDSNQDNSISIEEATPAPGFVHGFSLMDKNGDQLVDENELTQYLAESRNQARGEEESE